MLTIAKEAMLMRNWIMAEYPDLWDKFEDLLSEGYFDMEE